MPVRQFFQLHLHTVFTLVESHYSTCVNCVCSWQISFVTLTKLQSCDNYMNIFHTLISHYYYNWNATLEHWMSDVSKFVETNWFDNDKDRFQDTFLRSNCSLWKWSLPLSSLRTKYRSQQQTWLWSRRTLPRFRSKHAAGHILVCNEDTKIFHDSLFSIWISFLNGNRQTVEIWFRH